MNYFDDYYKHWVEKGEPRDHNGSVDHEVKMYYLQRTLREYGLRLFVESGTSHGDGTAAMLIHVDKVVTIEAWNEAYDYSKRRFVNEPKVELVYGDSGELLPDLLLEHNEPALFWLDAHYSGEGTAQLDSDTPIVAELEAIAESTFRDEHAIVIDDARGFGVNGGTVWKDYPSIEELTQMVNELLPNHVVATEGDEIFILPAV